MVGFEIVLDIIVSVTLLWLVGEGRKAPHTPSVEVEAEPTPLETEATLAVSAKQHARVAPVPDVDLPSIGELFQLSDQVGDRYLAPSEIEEREAARAAIAEVFAEVQPQRVGGGRRAYIESLFAQSEELRERDAVLTAAALTVAHVAVNQMSWRE